MASKADFFLAVATLAAACAVSSAQTKFGKLVITGVVPCNTGTLIDVATSPAFPDANVELRCGGNVVAGAKTSSNGSFAMEADMTNALAALVGGCELVVDTPLVKCDGKLPAAGALVSYLQGPLARLLSGVFQLAPAGFSFQMS
ncbi:phylloplanin [Lolium perenne]|uniref:phylloplanin n=1 Tax=Lolium perenne TaxID=4522 RepID=UPI0021EB187F|nr:phylloplanin-like [Lolium perenne]